MTEQRDPARDTGMSRHLARVMDDLVTIPGTRIGLGLDALLGLLPGAGDILGSGMSAAIMYDAASRRVPLLVLARMSWNMLIDAALGPVPVVGDAADVAHRANRKNYRLLQESLALGHRSSRSGPVYVLLAALLIVLPLVIGIVIGIVVLVALWRLLIR
ncbi:hypothetical protein SGUI_3285 [Serinicoccus hydrothermalis]|uniref:DUF4112 domain-containing protein n=1 Tax=Serinicoccus hydrothermalis TaxID=1758689 RepID=A0A1B1NH03_9MICO|nr:DUF4112 domain-containing protein [Serinicoccus hydrothermalis]ANS80681.1 hypothetical protein SGUI_3285 [Serinicoccus hydrothermalis]